MKQPKQLPYDRVLWSLTSLNEKAEWIELRIRTKLKAAELDDALCKLVKKEKLLIVTCSNSGSSSSLAAARASSAGWTAALWS
jgi:hypothetical protein